MYAIYLKQNVPDGPVQGWLGEDGCLTDDLYYARKFDDFDKACETLKSCDYQDCEVQEAEIRRL